jgi:chromosome segregation ATPase
MLEDNSADKQTLKDDEEDRERKSRKCIRDLKKEVKGLTDKVGLGLDGEAHLQRQLEKERQTRTTLEGRVGTFRQKIADLDKRTWEKDDSVRDLRAEVSEKERKITTMQKRVERVDTQNKTVVEKLEQERAALVEDLVKSNNEVSLWATHNSEVPPYPEPFPT